MHYGRRNANAQCACLHCAGTTRNALAARSIPHSCARQRTFAPRQTFQPAPNHHFSKVLDRSLSYHTTYPLHSHSPTLAELPFACCSPKQPQTANRVNSQPLCITHDATAMCSVPVCIVPAPHATHSLHVPSRTALPTKLHSHRDKPSSQRLDMTALKRCSTCRSATTQHTHCIHTCQTSQNCRSPAAPLNNHRQPIA